MDISISDDRGDRFLDLADLSLVALIQGPLLHPLRADQSSVRQHPQMNTGGRLSNAEFLGNENATDTVFDAAATDLFTKVCPGVLEPFQDLKPGPTGQGANCMSYIHSHGVSVLIGEAPKSKYSLLAKS